MAPASARQMASELALLPMWYAEEGSVVLAPSAYNLDYVKKIQELLGLSVDLMTEPRTCFGAEFGYSSLGLGYSNKKTTVGFGSGRKRASFY